MKQVFTVIGAVICSALVLLLTVFVQGVVLMNLWNWFIAPLGVTKIGYWMAFGISLTLKVFIEKSSKDDDDEDEGLFVSFFGTIIGYLVIWGIGAIIALFI